MNTTRTNFLIKEKQDMIKFLSKHSLKAITIIILLFVGCQDVADEFVGKERDDIRTINITMIAKSSTNPVFLSARRGAENAAKDLSDKYSKINVGISWRTPSVEDAESQIERMRNAVEDGTDAILLSCSDAEILTPVINEVVEKGIPVMTFDSDATDSKRFAFYGPDDVEIGKNVITELVQLIGDKGRIAILGGNQKAPNLQKRVEGIQMGLLDYPEIEVVGVFYHAETAEDAVAEVIRVNNSYPELKGWAMVGGWPFFNETLLDKIDSDKMKIVAVDALPMQLPYIEEGVVQVLLGQPTFKWGEVSVEKIVDKIYKEEDVPVINEMKLIRVSIENLGGWSRQLRAWGYTDIPEKYLIM